MQRYRPGAWLFPSASGSFSPRQSCTGPWSGSLSKPKKTPDHPGRFAYNGLDSLFHEKARLGIITSLVTHPRGLIFNELKELCALTDGNLSRHLRALNEAGLVEVWKGSHDGRPQTLCRLTESGKQSF